MTSQKLFGSVSKLLVAVIAVVALAGTSLAQAAPLPNQITVNSQDLNSGVITISSVTAAQAGWVVIYKNPNLTEGEIVGYAPVMAGTNTNVRVTIDTARVVDVPTLYAVLHVDAGVPGLFEWGLRNLPYNDGPVMQNGWYVEASFGTAARLQTTASAAGSTAQAAPVVTTDQITVDPMEHLNSGVIEVNAINATQDSWIVIYKNPNYSDGEIVGYAFVPKGANTNVKVTIDTWRLPAGQTTLWARLQADNGVPGRFEWGHKNQPYDDGPVVQNGQQVTAAFGISDW